MCTCEEGEVRVGAKKYYTMYFLNKDNDAKNYLG